MRRATEMAVGITSGPGCFSRATHVVRFMRAALHRQSSDMGCRAISARRDGHRPPLRVARATCAVGPISVAVGSHGDAGGRTGLLYGGRRGKLLPLHLLSLAGASTSSTVETGKAAAAASLKAGKAHLGE
jgi:hypothetical protein